MGAFFLFTNEEQFDKSAVKNLFRDMGLGEHKQFNLGGMTLWIYSKELLDVTNYYHSHTKSAIYVTGTLIYKGKSYNESMIELLQDFENKSVDVDELIGGFCVIFFKDNHVTIMHDRANIYHVFTNHKKSIISSSFSAIVKSSLSKLKLNKLAGLEYLTTGYIIGPDTYFDGIYLLNRNFERKVNNTKYSFFSYPDFETGIEFCKLKFDDCVDKNLELLKKYWRDISLLTEQYGAEQGLSGGYDTRLVLLLSKSLPVKISTHTHLAVDKIHTDVECAKLLTKEMGLEHKSIPVPPTKDLKPEDAEKIMQENLLWHDSRMGAELLRQIRTKHYRMEVLGNNRLTLNGVGGEIYRNYLHSGPGRIGFENFIKLWVIGSDGDFVIDNKLFKKDLVYYIIEKASKVLEIKNRRYINRLIAHRYYAEIRLAYWSGCKVSHENKLAFFLTPFPEFKISRQSYKFIPHFGCGGKFEAAMIKKIDMKIASLPNSYGSNFVNESLKNKVKTCTLAYTPNSIMSYLFKQKLRRINQVSTLYSNLNARVKPVQEAFQTLNDLNFPLNWERVRVYPRIIHSVINYGYILNTYSDKISFNI